MSHIKCGHRILLKLSSSEYLRLEVLYANPADAVIRIQMKIGTPLEQQLAILGKTKGAEKVKGSTFLPTVLQAANGRA